MVDTIARTSSTARPGYSPRETQGGAFTHAEWVSAVVSYLSSKWIHGDFTVPNGWVSAKYGEPDQADYVPGSNIQQASPRTLMAFTRYAEDYQPGKDASLDQLIPYTPPGPDDYIEDPITAAARIANEQWQKTFDFNAQQAGITNSTQLIQAKASAANAYNAAIQNLLSKYATDAEIYTNQNNRKSADYATRAGIYTGQEAERGANLRQAGSLAMALQQAYDARTGKAIDLSANPGDFIARESAVRALQAPTATNVPAYKNVDALTEVINRLINYKPNEAPVAPEYGAPPTAPSGTSTIPPELQALLNQLTNGTGGGAAGSAPGVTPPLPGAPAATTTTSLPANTGAVGVKPYKIPVDPNSYAGGGQGITDRQFIAGDPQVPGVPNQELIQIHNPGPKTTASVTPFASTIRRFAFGTDPAEGDLMLKSYPDEAYQNYPTLKYLQGRMSRTGYNTLSTGNARGAFGAQIPESGQINYGKYLNIERDPLSLALLASSYRSASRDLFSEVARAKARAPFGQAVQTSLVRT